MIYYDHRRGLQPGESLANLQEAFGDQAPSRATVYRWYGEFRRERSSVEDEPRSGRLPTAVTDENVAAVRRMIEEDARVSKKLVMQALNIGSGAVHTILHNHLHVSKRCARWVPHNLTDTQKADRLAWCRFMLEKFNGGSSRSVWDIVTGDETWVYQYDPETKSQSSVWLFVGETPPTKTSKSRSVGKKMVASFFSKTGHIATIPLEDQRTVTAHWYVHQCLPKVFDAWCTRRPKTGLRGLKLHHDNASAHTAAATLDFLAEKGVQLVTHPAYSPDLSPCDWFLFPYVKNQLRGKHFQNPDDACQKFLEVIEGIQSSEWSTVWDKWFDRMKLCIQAHGEYFEKLH